VVSAVQWVLFVDRAAIRSWAAAQPFVSSAFSLAVTTASGFGSKLVSACACRNTFGSWACSSRMLLAPRGLVANAWTSAAACGERAVAVDDGMRCSAPTRPRAGKTGSRRRIIA
jgi:hypothetical protein